MRKRRSLLQQDPAAPPRPGDAGGGAADGKPDVIEGGQGHYASEGRPADTTDIDWRPTPGPTLRRDEHGVAPVAIPRAAPAKPEPEKPVLVPRVPSPDEIPWDRPKAG